jgi:hypothetical protein
MGPREMTAASQKQRVSEPCVVRGKSCLELMMADVHSHRHLLAGTYEPLPLILSRTTTKNISWGFSSFWKSISLPCLLLYQPIQFSFLVVWFFTRVKRPLTVSPTVYPSEGPCVILTAFPWLQKTQHLSPLGGGDSSPRSTDDWDPSAVLCGIQQGKQSPHLVPARPIPSTSLDLTPKRGTSPDLPLLAYTILLGDQITHFRQETSFNLTLGGTFIIAPDRFWPVHCSRRPNSWAFQCGRRMFFQITDSRMSATPLVSFVDTDSRSPTTAPSWTHNWAPAETSCSLRSAFFCLAQFFVRLSSSSW